MNRSHKNSYDSSQVVMRQKNWTLIWVKLFSPVSVNFHQLTSQLFSNPEYLMRIQMVRMKLEAMIRI